jgi:glycosyltransferase involved in cell wall biosynthesis
VDEVRKAIARLDLGKRVALLGPTAGEQRWSMFDGATLFVLPSHAENFGNVVVEAMARGCPVVVTKEVQAASFVERAGAGVVVDGEAAEVAASLDSLLGDETRRRTAAENGRGFVGAHLQWPAIARNLSVMYSELVSSYGSNCNRPQ